MGRNPQIFDFGHFHKKGIISLNLAKSKIPSALQSLSTYIWRIWPDIPRDSWAGSQLTEFWQKCALFHAAGNPRAPGANFATLFHSDVPAGSFYRPVLKFLKNIKKCGLRNVWRKKFLRKKCFSVPGIPQNRKISKIWNFPKSSEKCLKSILGPKWSVLGEKWTFGARLKWDDATIKNVKYIKNIFECM